MRSTFLNKTFRAFLLLLLVSAGSAQTAGSAQAADFDYYVNFHRGGGAERPENTLETFLWAWNMDVIPEGDVQYTKDGVAVMFHDANVNRMVWDLPEELKGKRIRDLTWEEVRKFDVGTHAGTEFALQRIPTMESVFCAMANFPERMFYLDEKGLTEENLRQIAERVQHYGIQKQMFFTSGNYDKMLKWNEICPDGVGMLWLGYVWTKDKTANMEGLNAVLKRLRENDFRGVDHLVLHIQADLSKEDPFEPKSDFIRAFAKEMKDRGIPMETITWSNGKDPEVYRRLLDLGVTGIATDFPSVVMPIIEEARQKNAVKE